MGSIQISLNTKMLQTPRPVNHIPINIRPHRSGNSQRRTIGRIKRSKVTSSNLRSPIPAEQPVIKVQTHLRNHEMTRNN